MHHRGLSSHRTGRARPGMTFLEVVFAVALLAMLAATLLGATNFMVSRQRYEQRTLAAVEMANRLILQFLDDRESLPDPMQPISYGGDRYRWALDESLLTFRPARVQPAAEGKTITTFENFRVFKVRVWLAEDSGGSVQVAMGVPHAEVSRMYDLGLLFRNPDTLEHLIHSEEGMRKLREGTSNTPLGIQPRTTAPAKSGAGK